MTDPVKLLLRSALCCALLLLQACGGGGGGGGDGGPDPDTTAPSVPAGLNSTGATTTSITLAWTGSADDAGGSGVRDYLVRRDGAQVAVVNVPSYTDTGLAAGTSYAYSVAARDNADNVSNVSATLSASTLAAPDTTAPSVPRG